MQVDNTDPDSRPGSGTADGEDDAAITDIRTTPVSDSAVYASPNPNQFPVPAVQSNQPAPDPNLADLSVRLVVSNRAPNLNDILTYTVFVTNAGGATAGNINLAAYLPAGQQFVPGNAFSQNGNTLTATIGSLAANSTAQLIFRTQVTVSGQSLVNLQITAASPSDPDSTPNNGTDNR